MHDFFEKTENFIEFDRIFSDSSEKLNLRS